MRDRVNHFPSSCSRPWMCASGLRSGRARVGLINRAAALSISPVSDERQWGVADHWSDPFETLLANRGYCEDYAILKYAALLEAAIPKDDVMIVILKNFFPNETHAAVATRVDGHWLILDNRTMAGLWARLNVLFSPAEGPIKKKSILILPRRSGGGAGRMWLCVV